MDIRKFNEEIQGLKSLPQSEGLHPLKREQIKQQMLQAIRLESRLPKEQYIRLERRSRLIRYAVTTLLGLSLVGGTAFASNTAKPGDVLFPVKKAKEQIQLNLTVSEQSRAQLQAKFAQERLKEVGELAEQNNSHSNVFINATSSTATSSEVVNNDGKNSKLEIKAKQDARAEVDNALQVLKKVRAKLQVKGNTTAADAIQENILKLKTQARLQHINSAEIDNSDDEEKNNSRPLQQATTTDPTQLQIDVRQEGSVKGERKSSGNNENLEINTELGRSLEDR